MKQQFPLRITAGLFKGLADQNMLFHQCLCELVDNSIAAKREDIPFRIDVILKRKEDPNRLSLYVVDNSNGMDYQRLQEAMQPGVSATTNHRLNEHGFGIKHSLATLTMETGWWKIWSRTPEADNVCSIEAPFGNEMTIEDNDSFPELPYSVRNISTVVGADITMEYFRSVQGRYYKTSSLELLRLWLVEHLGVTYRGYLTQDPQNNYEVDGCIYVSVDDNIVKVPPIEIPMEATKYHTFDVEIGGELRRLSYCIGNIADCKRDEAMNGKGLRAYYQKNMSSQGIDIRLGKRIIATKQLQNIFGVVPDPHYNSFVGELLIPELPRNLLRTTNNKSDINFNDKDWTAIFEALRAFDLPQNLKKMTERERQIEWKNRLQSADPRDTVVTDISVWTAGVMIDVYRKKHTTQEVILYELKVGRAKPIHLYQLKMYWDGCVLNQDFPSEAWLICDEYNDPLREMAARMNTLKPQEGSLPYKFVLKTYEDIMLPEASSRKKKIHKVRTTLFN